MSNPAYLWFIDENGSPIVGGSMVLGREGSIEVKSLSYHLTIPTDRNTGCYETIQWKYTDGTSSLKMAGTSEPLPNGILAIIDSNFRVLLIS